MNTAVFELAPSLQRLLDARLDNIDRALLGSDLSRVERRQIVSSVEDQIHEMIDRLGREEPTREEILHILASIDPPEAYGDGTSGRRDVSELRLSRSLQSSENVSSKTGTSTLGILGLVLSGLCILTGPSIFFLGILAIPFLILLSLSGMICGIVSLCQISASQGKLTGTWMGVVAVTTFPLMALGLCLLVLMEM